MRIVQTGSYIVDCEEIQRNWSAEAENITLGIGRTYEEVVFLACFDFGVVEGVMLISADEAL